MGVERDGRELTAARLAAAIDRHGNPSRVEALQRFFKTRTGEYGEGDVFIGARVPDIRAAVESFEGLALDEVVVILESPVHEHRLAGLIILVSRFRAASRTRTRDDAERERLHRLYLDTLRSGHVNNWDLVDTSAETLVGDWLRDRSIAEAEQVLITLARSEHLWERRAAALATFSWIKAGSAEPTLRVAEELLDDREPLIHKAVGWMLREVGKRVDRGVLLEFLSEHGERMPRTMTRYATEHLRRS